MKKTHLYIALLAAITPLFSCNGGSTTTTTSDSTTLSPGDSSVTTTTTTTVTHHKYAGNFSPQPNVKYLDLRTNKQITVRIDTVQGRIVNYETDEPVDLFVDPTKKDTIYGQTGSVVNNYIIKEDNGSYRVDTVRINTIEVHTVPPEPTNETGQRTKTKIKDGEEKVKTGRDKTKIK
ncbi:MAG: hypothetical protein JWM28_1896 [Chitinophagaceae bacterium]|nr:hypothetical protein [Chitinophagaceae bacterium]